MELQCKYDACERIPARHTKAEGRGDCRRYELRVTDRRKVDERGTVGALPCRRMGCGDRDRRLADAAEPTIDTSRVSSKSRRMASIASVLPKMRVVPVGKPWSPDAADVDANANSAETLA